MWLLERCRQQWQDVSYGDLIIAAKSSDAFRSLIDPDDPFFPIQGICNTPFRNIVYVQNRMFP